MILTVMDTEEVKPKHAVEKRARDGMFKHLKSMIMIQQNTPMRDWNRISVETQIMSQQFGASQQIQLTYLNIVTHYIVGMEMDLLIKWNSCM